MKQLRIYVDSSVFGGYFDAEFERESRRFFSMVRAQRIVALVSEVVVRELEEAPLAVRLLLGSLPREGVVDVGLTTDVIALRDAYIRARILTPRSIDDATHVAAATVSRADAIVSWNFQHIVRLDKMRRYNQVNLRMGYGILAIVSPVEVRTDEDQ